MSQAARAVTAASGLPSHASPDLHSIQAAPDRGRPFFVRAFQPERSSVSDDPRLDALDIGDDDVSMCACNDVLMGEASKMRRRLRLRHLAGAAASRGEQPGE